MYYIIQRYESQLHQYEQPVKLSQKKSAIRPVLSPRKDIIPISEISASTNVEV